MDFFSPRLLLIAKKSEEDFFFFSPDVKKMFPTSLCLSVFPFFILSGFY